MTGDHWAMWNANRILADASTEEVRRDALLFRKSLMGADRTIGRLVSVFDCLLVCQHRFQRFQGFQPSYTKYFNRRYVDTALPGTLFRDRVEKRTGADRRANFADIGGALAGV